MNHKSSAGSHKSRQTWPPLFFLGLMVLMLQVMSPSLHAGFFKIEGIEELKKEPKDGIGVWYDESQVPGKAPKHWFLPCLEVKLKTEENILVKDTTVKCYFYDQNKKLLSSMNIPSTAGKNIDHGVLPTLLKKEETSRVFFQIPKEIAINDLHAVIVFGDTHEAVAMTYPQILSASAFDYPEKKLVEDLSLKNIKRKPAIDPLVEYKAKSGVIDAKHPQITLFLRMPQGVSNASELQGVMAICVLAGSVESIKTDLQKPEMTGDYNGLFAYANKHKLALLVWGMTGTILNPSKNYNAMTQKAFRDMEGSLSEVADTWEKGVLELSEKYGIPKKNFLLWGACGSAQWVQRLCLRKPDYFLATYMIIPGSFDKPTPEASKVLWCLCTGELYGGYQNALQWYKECQAMGYPMIFKAYIGLGHATSPASLGMAFKFFDFALTQQDLREEHDKNMESRIAQTQLAASGQLQGPWPEAFKHPVSYGDIVNQESAPADQVEMIPAGFRTPLPTKELADYWEISK